MAFSIEPPQNIGIEISKIKLNNIRLSADGSGTWTIGVSFDPKPSERTKDSTVSLVERHIMSAEVTISRAEIGASQGLAEEEVKTNLTLAQTEQIVTSLALGKLENVLGITVTIS